MGSKQTKNRSGFLVAGINLVILVIIFLFSGPCVNHYYKIQTPKPFKVIEVIPGFSQKAIDPESIKTLTWNVYKGQREGWSDDFNGLSNDMDIILIQEARLKEKGQEAFCIKGMGGVFAQSFSYHSDSLARTGIMTISRACPLWTGHSRTRFKEPFTHTPKVSLFTKYSLKGTQEKLLVVNTHGINFVRSAAFESQMADLGKKINDHQGPIIFAGDFNTWNKTRTIILRSIINQSGMKEANFHPDTRSKRFGYFLDHVFYKGLKIKQTKVFETINSSDHKAVGIEFCLAQNPGLG
jgi:endonuclease/exonuclease/phosphatase (EEP) superfamily protein YafD